MRTYVSSKYTQFIMRYFLFIWSALFGVGTLATVYLEPSQWFVPAGVLSIGLLLSAYISKKAVEVSFDEKGIYLKRQKLEVALPFGVIESVSFKVLNRWGEVCFIQKTEFGKSVWFMLKLKYLFGVTPELSMLRKHIKQAT